MVAGGRAGAIAAHGQTTHPEPAARHSAFDTCEAPSLDSMRAWRDSSPYGSVAVYIGGAARACPNTALDSPGWVTSVLQDGWGIIPVYVGQQAPCSDFQTPIDPSGPYFQGLYEGFEAVRRARIAGIPEGSPIYLDIEAWANSDAACDAVVRAYIENWVVGVHYFGFSAGLYSTPDSGIRVMADGGQGLKRLDSIWVARWNNAPGNFETPTADAYAGSRIHQYQGDHVETYGGFTLEIDSNAVDAPVARYSTGH